jgi:hypothetical protein
MSRWYMNDVPPATSGMYAYGRCAASATSFGDDRTRRVAVRRGERDLRRREVDLVLVVEDATRGGADALVVDREALARDVGRHWSSAICDPRGAGAVDAHVGVRRPAPSGTQRRLRHESDERRAGRTAVGEDRRRHPNVRVT